MHIRYNHILHPCASFVKLTECLHCFNREFIPISYIPHFAASESRVVGLVRSLARPLATEHIRINALAPSVIGKSKHDCYRIPHRLVVAWTNHVDYRNEHCTEFGFVQGHGVHADVYCCKCSSTACDRSIIDRKGRGITW